MRPLSTLLCAGALLTSVLTAPAEEALAAKAEPGLSPEIAALAQDFVESFTQIYDHRVSDLQRELALSKERQEPLSKKTKDLAELQVEAWKKSVASRKVHLTSDGRLLDEQSQLAYPLVPDFVEDAPWQKALAATLSPEELQTVNAAAAARQARRSRALSQTMVLVLDEHLALDSRQRELLRPLAERLLKGYPITPGMEDEPGEDDADANLSDTVFFGAGAAAKDEELRLILNETQLRHWRECCLPPPKELEETADDEDDNSETDSDDAQVFRPLPDEAEHTLSDYLAGKAAATRREYLSAVLLRIEEMDRLCALPEPQKLRLQTAARGAAEGALEIWRLPFEQEVRAKLRASRLPIAQRLLGIDRELLQERMNQGSRGTWTETVQAVAEQPRWVNTLKEVRGSLTAAQRQTLKTAEAERAAFRTRTLVDGVVMSFDHKYLLTGEQHEKLVDLVAALLKNRGAENPEHHAEIVSDYLQSQYRFVSLFGLPKKTLQETLTEAQWKEWKDSADYSDSASYWATLQQNHRRN